MIAIERAKPEEVDPIRRLPGETWIDTCAVRLIRSTIARSLHGVSPRHPPGPEVA